MKLPRNLYGRELARVLCARWAYQQVHQVGVAKSVATVPTVHGSDVQA